MKKLLLLTSALFIGAISSFGQITKTSVEQGQIEGIVKGEGVLYPKIPYAEAPVGNLRWKSPVPKKAWTGVYKAEDYGQKPFQPGNEEYTEDCLNLLVQTPAKTVNDKLPVYVNIHGGGYTSGSYQGTLDDFVKAGIVYVSVEYRLGVLGFMAHPELSKESQDGISGNYGIQDQILALKWVKNNIKNFGGDPDNITISGESAGGISVSILCASPQCKGLFNRAVCESGSSFWPVGENRNGNTAICTSKSAENFGLEFQKKIGAKNLKALRAMDAKKLTDAQGFEAFWPVVDGKNILDDQYKLYQQGNYNDVDIIVGTNSDEGWMFSGEYPVEGYIGRFKAVYGEYFDKLIQLYPASNPYEVRCATADIFRDGSFAWGTYAWAKLQKQTGKSNVYMYYFDQNSKNTLLVSPRGASHVAEMPFIYNWNWGPMTECDQHIANILQKYFINFIKTGNPNQDELPFWSQFEDGEPTVLNINNGIRLTTIPNKEKLDFFEEFFKSKRK